MCFIGEDDMVVTKGRYMFRVDLQIIPVFSDGSGGKQSKGVHDDGYEDNL